MGFHKWIKQKRLRKKRKADLGRKKGKRSESYKIKRNKDGVKIDKKK